MQESQGLMWGGPQERWGGGGSYSSERAWPPSAYAGAKGGDPSWLGAGPKGSLGGKGSMGKPWASGTGTKVSKTVGWMNREGRLAQPVRFSEVSQLLDAIGEEEAGRLLFELGGHAAEVKDPTSWLKSAAQRRLDGYSRPVGSYGAGGSGKGWGKGQWPMQPPQYDWGKGGGWGSPSYCSEWVSKKVGWLNKSGKLTQPIMFKTVSGPFSAIPESAAMGLLKELEEKAAEIKDPTAWLSSACLRFGSRKWKSFPEISKRIGVLNKSETLVSSIMYEDVIGPLSCLEEATAMELIAELEGLGKAVKKPTSWLQAAAARRAKRPSSDAQPQPQPQLEQL